MRCLTGGAERSLNHLELKLNKGGFSVSLTFESFVTTLVEGVMKTLKDDFEEEPFDYQHQGPLLGTRIPIYLGPIYDEEDKPGPIFDETTPSITSIIMESQLCFDPNYAITCLETLLVINSYFDVRFEKLKRSVQDEQVQPQKSESIDRAHQPEIWRCMYARDGADHGRRRDDKKSSPPEKLLKQSASNEPKVIPQPILCQSQKHCKDHGLILSAHHENVLNPGISKEKQIFTWLKNVFLMSFHELFSSSCALKEIWSGKEHELKLLRPENQFDFVHVEKFLKLAPSISFSNSFTALHDFETNLKVSLVVLKEQVNHDQILRIASRGGRHNTCVAGTRNWNHEASTHEITCRMFSTQLQSSSMKNQIKRSSYVTVMPFKIQGVSARDDQEDSPGDEVLAIDQGRRGRMVRPSREADGKILIFGFHSSSFLIRESFSTIVLRFLKVVE
ncbi:hypothetical protein IGI04_040039 [Brassica rapa subsp. trilocularis]|uniref:FBD domain-containing protein n=1 Tax=Brassica rapa subsp. trilocularis TaxID=1813537 RepID=A0ABQ7KLN5_BRACM|nr:hypothetical protein IGI04_040039 [Brassica rapa subsp. trilocularis]